MGSIDESNKPSNLYDPPSSPSQPLLSKHFPSIDAPISHTDAATSEPDQTQYLQISYNYGPRPIKDLPFVILFLLFALSTFAFGISASVNRNPNSNSISSFVFDSVSYSCIKNSSTYASHYQNQLFFGTAISLSSSNSGLWESLIWTLVITLILSVPFVLFVLYSSSIIPNRLSTFRFL